MRESGKVDYFELPGGDLATTRGFYEAAFGWHFIDYGPSYAAVDNAGLDGGFQADSRETPQMPLVILYADDLEAMLVKVVAAGGRVVRPIFAFPGGRRFHFRDPAENELAVWSER